MRLTTDRRYRFPFGPDELWTRISRTDEFQTWWPWLRDFDGRGLSTDDVWSCEVRPPVLYVVRFAVTLHEVVAGRSIAARVSGDIDGSATLHVEADGSGSSAWLVADLAPRKRTLRVMSIVARPLLRFGHNWILDTGVRQFRERSHGSSE